MRVTVLAAGTRGDAEPCLAVADALAARGHEVRAATHERFRELTGPEVEFASLPGDPNTLFDHAGWQALTVSRWRPRAHAAVIHDAVGGLLAQIGPEDLDRACAGADLVVFGMTTPAGREAAQRAHARSACIALGPFHRTRAFAQPVLASHLQLGGWGNLVTYPVAERLLGQPFLEPLRPRTRVAHGLGRIPLSERGGDRSWPPFPVVHLFSEAVVPRPPDWPAQLQIAGFAFRRGDVEPKLPPAVASFLEAGPPPVYIGFGSMRPPDAARLSATVVDGVRGAGQRAIVASGWARLAEGDKADDLLVVDSVSHEALFPHVAGVVHHGGVGTTAAGLRAGRPTAVIPFVFDQAFWGRRVAAHGAGPAPIEVARLTSERLKRALTELARPDVREAAEELGHRIRGEDGAAVAAGLLEATDG